MVQTTSPVPRPARRWLSARPATLIGIALFVLGLASFVGSDLPARIDARHAYDFEINVVGAHRLVTGDALYDMRGGREDMMAMFAPEVKDIFADVFSSYIGPPAVALAHAPFLAPDPTTATRWFRIMTVALAIASIVLTARVLSPPSARLGGALAGTGALLLLQPFVVTLTLGQSHGLVMLALAAGIWGVARDRPALAGAALGVATVIKLSPALLLVYLVVRGRRQVLVPALASAGALCAGAAALGQPTAVFTWAREIAPQLSAATRFVNNQSLPGLVERVTTSSTDFVTRAPLGGVRLLGIACALAMTGALWFVRRGKPIDPLELGAIVLVLLLAGPLSWDHYFVWAVLPITLLVDPRAWGALRLRSRLVLGGAVAIALALLHLPIRQHPPAVIRSDWTLRLTGSPYPLAVLLLLLVVIALLTRLPGPPARPRSADRTSVRFPADGGSLAGLWPTPSRSGGRASTTSATSTWSCRATA